jgi:PIN domain nuclease of toxin-antitoxin system
MHYLLDTHTFLWMAGDPLSLSEKVRVIVEEKNNHLYLSAASAWEIAMLQQLKRLELPDVPQRFVAEALQQLSVLPIPIGFTTAISAATLPFIHRDPFDRIIIAEALKEKMTVLTKDVLFKSYGAKTVWR